MLEHERGGENGRGGIGDPAARDVGGGTVDRLEVGPAVVAEVAGGRQPEAAGGFRAQVREDVAVEVHAEDHVHGLREAHQAPRGVVHVEVLELDPARRAHHALGDLLEEPVGLAHHVRLGDAGHLAGLAPRLALLREIGGEASDALGAARRDHLDREAALGAVFLQGAPRAVTEVRHEPDDIGELALAPGIDPLAVLAQEDIVDALRVRQRRAHARIEPDGPDARPRAHLPAEPGHHRRGGGAGGAEEHAVRLAGRPLGFLRQRRALRRREDLERQAGGRQELAGGVHDLEPDAFPGQRDDGLHGP